MEKDLVLIFFAIDRNEGEFFNDFFNLVVVKLFNVYFVTDEDVLNSFQNDRGD